MELLFIISLVFGSIIGYFAYNTEIKPKENIYYPEKPSGFLEKRKQISVPSELDFFISNLKTQKYNDIKKTVIKEIHYRNYEYSDYCEFM